MVGWLCGVIDGGDEIECARQIYIFRAFNFTGLDFDREVLGRV